MVKPLTLNYSKTVEDFSSLLQNAKIREGLIKAGRPSQKFSFNELIAAIQQSLSRDECNDIKNLIKGVRLETTPNSELKQLALKIALLQWGIQYNHE